MLGAHTLHVLREEDKKKQQKKKHHGAKGHNHHQHHHAAGHSNCNGALRHRSPQPRLPSHASENDLLALPAMTRKRSNSCSNPPIFVGKSNLMVPQNRVNSISTETLTLDVAAAMMKHFQHKRDHSAASTPSKEKPPPDDRIKVPSLKNLRLFSSRSHSSSPSRTTTNVEK